MRIGTGPFQVVVDEGDGAGPEAGVPVGAPLVTPTAACEAVACGGDGCEADACEPLKGRAIDPPLPKVRVAIMMTTPTQPATARRTKRRVQPDRLMSSLRVRRMLQALPFSCDHVLDQMLACPGEETRTTVPP
jgi:hypothetical protein